MKKLKFKATLKGVPGMDTAALNAPFDVADVFGTRARVPVRGKINGFPFRSSLMPMDGCHRMVVNREIREGAGVKAGDTVTVEMERDDAPRTVVAPSTENGIGTEQNRASKLGETLLYSQKGDGALDCRGQTRRNAGKATGQSHGRTQDWKEVDGLALIECSHYFVNVVLLKKADGSNAQCASRDAGRSIRYGHPAQGKHRNSSLAGLTQNLEPGGLLPLFFEDWSE